MVYAAHSQGCRYVRAIDRENGMEAMLYPYPSIVYREKGLYIVAVYGG